MLGRRYYRNNDYDVVKLELGRPRTYHFLTKYGLNSTTAFPTRYLSPLRVSRSTFTMITTCIAHG